MVIGNYWTKLPTFNPPICNSMHMHYFIKIANFYFAKMFFSVLSNNTLANVSSYMVHRITLNSYRFVEKHM